MKIIVGLGNPGRKYDRTPHNVGFEVIDELGKRWGASFRRSSRDESEIAEHRIGDEAVLLAKPMTWMNLSGQAARELIRNRPAELSDFLVVSDDVNLDIGRMRIRDRGSNGGHNGLRSIIECVGSQDFPRLRVGIRPTRPIDDLAQFVLSVPKPEERKALKEMAGIAADAAEYWIQRGVQATANKYNGYSGS